jgi:hypothetical protein
MFSRALRTILMKCPTVPEAISEGAQPLINCSPGRGNLRNTEPSISYLLLPAPSLGPIQRKSVMKKMQWFEYEMFPTGSYIGTGLQIEGLLESDWMVKALA